MPLTSDTNQSMSLEQIRTEYFGGSYTGPISMNQLYRGGSYVDSTKEVTDAISGRPSYTFNGVADRDNSSFGYGYSNRYMYGNLHTYSGGIGAGGTFAYGYIYNNQALSSVFNTRIINNGGIYGSNYVSGGYADYILMHMGTTGSVYQQGSVNQATEILTATMSRAGTYYVLAKSNDGAGTLKIEVNTGSGFSTVYNTTQLTTTLSSKYTFNASVGDQIRFTLYGNTEQISRHYFLSTSSTGADKTINLNTSVPDGTTGNETISLGNFYGGENA
tara:strand:- start:3996 stop:4817 length:822 start_codon:yes stop_codon:yes gene_type:complete